MICSSNEIRLNESPIFQNSHPSRPKAHACTCTCIYEGQTRCYLPGYIVNLPSRMVCGPARAFYVSSYSLVLSAASTLLECTVVVDWVWFKYIYMSSLCVGSAVEGVNCDETSAIAWPCGAYVDRSKSCSTCCWFAPVAEWRFVQSGQGGLDQLCAPCVQWGNKSILHSCSNIAFYVSD